MSIPRLALVVCICLLGAMHASQAQQQAGPTIPTPGSMSHDGRPIVQFTGLVVAGERAYGVPGVSVYLPRSRRGTTTNNLGYFSIPVLAGDTANIAAVGYRRKRYMVPASPTSSVSVIIYLEADTLQLPTVEIMPYPTEALFKEAFLALNLNDRDVRNARENLDPYKMSEMMANAPASSAENFRTYSYNNVAKQDARYQVPTLSLTNPFAWAQFINSVKRGDFKKKEKKEE